MDDLQASPGQGFVERVGIYPVILGVWSQVLAVTELLVGYRSLVATNPHPGDGVNGVVQAPVTTAAESVPTGAYGRG